jgi:hypothetical protein
MIPLIPLKFGTALEYTKKFLDAPDDKHSEWTFLGVVIKADFNITLQNIASFAIEILDKIAEIERTADSNASRIIIKNNQVDVE